MREQSRVVLTFWSVLVGLAAVLLAVRLTKPTAPSPVATALGQRLAELARRSRLEAPSAERLLLLVWRPADRCGRYHGAAFITGWDRRGAIVGAETQLAFTLEAHPQLTLRNPSRQPLPAVVLARHELRSDLVEPGDARQLLVHFESGMAENPGASRLSIDNLAGPGQKATGQATNRAFAGLAGSSHCDLSLPAAQRLALLESLLRAKVCPASGDGPCRDAVLTLGPTKREGIVRGEVRAQGEPPTGVFELAVGLTSEGRLEALTVVGLGSATDSGAIATLSVHRPVAPGQPMSPAAAEIADLPLSGSEPAPAVRVELWPLLEGSGWEKVTLPWR